jgi:hypothetical protein
MDRFKLSTISTTECSIFVVLGIQVHQKGA